MRGMASEPFAVKCTRGCSVIKAFTVICAAALVACSSGTVDSRSLRPVPLGRGGHRVGEDGKHIEGDVLSQPVTVPPTPNSALSATWRLVVPGGLLPVSWTPT